MRPSPRYYSPTPAPLSDAEMTQHITAAYAALNSGLDAASTKDANYAHDGRRRYLLTLSPESRLASLGIGTLSDARTNREYDIRVCFGSNHSDVQLKREYFEDIGSAVRIKETSIRLLFASFLLHLREINNPRSPGHWSFGPGSIRYGNELVMSGS